MFGSYYSFYLLVKKETGIYISYNDCLAADKIKAEKEALIIKWNSEKVYLKLTINPAAVSAAV